MSDPSTDARQIRADQLKERIYLTFAALAVVLALGSHSEEDAVAALTTLVVTVLGTLLAIFLADILSHLVVHERMLTASEFRHATLSSFGALGAVTLPFAFLVVAAFGLWSTMAALRASAIALLVALVVIGFAAARRTRLRRWQRLLFLGAEAVLGLVVIGLQLLAHGA